MIAARDVMTRTVYTLSIETPLQAAADALAARDVFGAPVCDAHGKLVGVISKADLSDACSGPIPWRSSCVEDIMRTDVLRARPDEALDEVVKRMVFEGAHHVVVVDDADAIVGIVTPLDVLRAVSQNPPEQFTARTERISRFPSWPER